VSAVRRLARSLRWPAQPLLRHLSLAGLAGIGCYAVSVTVSDFANSEIATVALFAVAIAGLSMLTGGTGQLSLGHGALMAVGAYTYAELELHHPHVPLGVGLLAAGGATALAGGVLGVAAARLRGPYLAGVTLALALVAPQLADHFFNSDQGVGVSLTPPASVESNHWLAWIAMTCALVVFVLLANLKKSRFHRSFTAVRDDEIAASLAGISVARTQILAFVLSAACAGLAGALLAIADLGATSGLFPLTLSVQLVAGMVVGGFGSLLGSVFGAVLVVYIPIWLDDLINSPSSTLAANLPQAVFGLLIIVVILLVPGGIEGALRRGVSLSRRLTGRSVEAARAQPIAQNTSDTVTEIGSLDGG
jgi:branched-chain amino acid transport system permease protein